MKKAIAKVGAVVEVPVSQFAPNRRGWNGWLFATGIIRKIYTSTTGRKCYQVEYQDHRSKEVRTITKGFVVEHVFDASDSIARHQKFVDDHTLEQFKNATGTEVVKFLAANNLVTLKEV